MPVPNDRPHQLIVNPASGDGRGLRALPEIQAALTDRGLTFVTHLTRDLPHASELAERAVAGGAVAVAVGGDGVVAAVASAVSANSGVMGIVPTGRGNDFARSLGIHDRATAFSAVTTGIERRVDLGAVGDRLFTCVASVGLDSRVVERAGRTRFVRGRMVYPYATLRELARWQCASFGLEVDGRSYDVRGYLVAVANAGVYGGGMRIAPEASMDDGLLDVVTIGRVSRARFLMAAPRIFRGSHVDHPAVRVHRGRSVRIVADGGLSVVADGEALGTSEVSIEVRPGALHVLVPAHP